MLETRETLHLKTPWKPIQHLENWCLLGGYEIPKKTLENPEPRPEPHLQSAIWLQLFKEAWIVLMHHDQGPFHLLQSWVWNYPLNNNTKLLSNATVSSGAPEDLREFVSHARPVRNFKMHVIQILRLKHTTRKKSRKSAFVYQNLEQILLFFKR